MKYLLILSTLLFIPFAHAETSQAAGTRVSLSAAASQEAVNDELIVHYRISERGSNGKMLQQKVNALAQKIETRLKSEKVKHKTTGRQLSPVSSDGVFSTREWEMVQSGEIRTEELEAVSGWLADIEATGAKLTHLQFKVSDAAYKKIEERLKLKAIASFRIKAATIAKGLSSKSFKIILLNTSGSAPVMAYRQEKSYSMLSKASSAPQMSAGESTIKVSVSGTIEVPFKSFSVQ
jgi:predicted secreted protein